MNKFNIFIIFPNEATVTEGISDSEDFTRFLKNINDLIDRTDCEVGTKLFFDNAELIAFTTALEALVYAGEFYLIKPKRILSQLLKIAEDWTEKPLHKSAYFYGDWQFNSRLVVQELPPSVKEAVEYASQGKTAFLHVKNEVNAIYNPFFILKDTSSPVESKLPTFTQLDQIHNLDSLEKWFQTNRTRRQLNDKDERHNERSAKYVTKPEKKSPLLYDFRFDTAGIVYVQTLLDEAIGDAQESKDLMNYDLQKKRYIWFENENTNNQYHAYHLAKPNSHEEDDRAVARIPSRAKRFIDSQKKNV